MTPHGPRTDLGAVCALTMTIGSTFNAGRMHTAQIITTACQQYSGLLSYSVASYSAVSLTT